MSQKKRTKRTAPEAHHPGSRKRNRRTQQDKKSGKGYTPKRTSLKGLEWVEHATGRPSFPASVKKAMRANQIAGLVYERKLGEYLEDRYGEDRVLHGPWLRYKDDRGIGYAQPDFVILPEDDGGVLIIVEAKLSYTKTSAERKLKYIYEPLVKEVWPWASEYKLVQACKNLREWTPRELVFRDIGEAFTHPERYKVLHWRPIL